MSKVGTELQCKQPDCAVRFVKEAVAQKFCDKHRDHRVRRTEISDEKHRLAALIPDLTVRNNRISRLCTRTGCGKKLYGEAALDRRRKYCSEDCAAIAHRRVNKENVRQHRALKTAETSGWEPSDLERRGEVLGQLVDTGGAEAIDMGELSAVAAAEMVGVTPAAISRAMEAYRFDKGKSAATSTWRRSKRIRAMFPTEVLNRVRELGKDPASVGTDEFEQLVDILVRAYHVMSRRFFRLERNRPIVKEFHERWVRSIMVAYATGGKLLILSPPRHGKSETLIRLFVWLIVMDAEIRIAWLASSKDIAKMMLGAVKGQLQYNQDLIRATLPPGDKYKPEHGSGKPWGAYQFTITQAPEFGQKSYTMSALGRTSKVIGRDVDVLAVDDIEDFDTTMNSDQRNYSKEKFAEFGTRKEERTVWFNIGSRQHPDDIPNALMSGGSDDDGLGWEILVDAAHDELGCTLDPDVIAGHDENGCVLFPEVRSYRWLMEKQREEVDLGVIGRYEMRYLNAPKSGKTLIFDVPKIKDNSLDRSRGLGLDELPDGKLIAGIDPAPRGIQATFGWHFANGTLNMFDLETEQAGGFAGAFEVIERWFHQYGITDWVFEDNASQTEFFRDPRLFALKKKYGLTVQPHTTGKNKQDPELGISAMAPFYHDGTISLPYGTTEARKKVNHLLRQLELWTTDGVQRGKTDIKMASWLPFPRLLRWMRSTDIQSSVSEQQTPGYPTPNSRNSLAWHTNYPKR